MRILHVVPTYLPATRYGGPIYAVHGLCRALAARGHDVHVYTTNVDGAGVSPVALGATVDVEGVKVRYFPTALGRRLYRSPPMGAALADAMASFDVLHLHSVFLWPTSAAARLARAQGVPYFLAPRGMLVADLIRRRSRLPKSAWIELFERRNIAGAAALHFTSDRERRDMEALGLAAQAAIVVPNGVDMPPQSAPTAGAGRPFVLALGRINWKKGLDRLIAALAHAPGVDLVVAGDDEGDTTAQLRGVARAHGVAERVTFAGPAHGAGKWALMRACAALALPSYSENFGNVVLEAMACARPTIVTPEVGLADVVAQSGAGLVVAGDPQPLGEAIATLMADAALRARMGEAGRKVARERFSWAAVAADMEGHYARARAPRRMETSPVV